MKLSHPNNKFSLAKILFEYLYLRDKIVKADAVIGFGHFDEKIPLHCGSLYSQGYARYIIFSGGIGAGSTGLNKPEAQEFFSKLCLHFPEIPQEKIILEDKSTNTGENIQFTLSLLEQKYSESLSPYSIKKLVLVANAYRQRRVYLTCKKYLKNIELINCPPITSFEEENKMFDLLGENFFIHLLNELEKIRIYPAIGFIEYDEIPEKILINSEKLKKIVQSG